MSECIFCRIAAGEVPANIVAEGETWTAFHDLHPVAPVHLLVIPKTHVASLDACSDPRLIGEVLCAAAECARKLGIADSGYRTVLNTGDDGGQTVHHLHAHVLGGRHLSWPPG